MPDSVQQKLHQRPRKTFDHKRPSLRVGVPATRIGSKTTLHSAHVVLFSYPLFAHSWMHLSPNTWRQLARWGSSGCASSSFFISSTAGNRYPLELLWLVKATSNASLQIKHSRSSSGIDYISIFRNKRASLYSFSKTNISGRLMACLVATITIRWKMAGWVEVPAIPRPKFVSLAHFYILRLWLKQALLGVGFVCSIWFERYVGHKST